MKTFLRHMATGHYFRSPQKWTLDRDEAHDFHRVSEALKTAHKLHIRDLELELTFEDSEAPPAIPFQKFLLGRAHCRNHRAPAVLRPAHAQ